MHSKFIIGVYDDALAMAVVSGNFIPKDWERKTESVWAQRFPLKPPGSGAAASTSATAASSSSSTSTAAAAASDFEAHLLAYMGALAACRVPTGTIIGHIRRFDFSAATAQLVGSVPGTHPVVPLRPALPGAALPLVWGHLRLRQLLRAEPPPVLPPPGAGGGGGGRWRTVCVNQFSSMGSIRDDWLPREWLDSMTATSGSGGGSAPQPPLAGHKRPRDDNGGSGGAGSSAASSAGAAAAPAAFAGAAAARDDIVLVYPSAEFVRRSQEGWDGGVALPSQGQHQGLDVVRTRLHHYESGVCDRERCNPHIKTFMRLALPPPPAQTAAAASTSSSSSSAGATDTADAEAARVLWLYTGSHNLSMAAWGQLSADGGGGGKGGKALSAPPQRHLLVRSYELGVLVTPHHYARALALLDAQGCGPAAQAAAAAEAAVAAAAAAAAAAEAAAHPTHSQLASRVMTLHAHAGWDDDEELEDEGEEEEGGGDGARANREGSYSPPPPPPAPSRGAGGGRAAATVGDDGVVDLVSSSDDDDDDNNGAGSGSAAAPAPPSSGPAVPSLPPTSYAVTLRLAYQQPPPAALLPPPLGDDPQPGLPLPVLPPGSYAGRAGVPVTVLLPVPFEAVAPRRFGGGADRPWATSPLSPRRFPGSDGYGHIHDLNHLGMVDVKAASEDVPPEPEAVKVGGVALPR